MVSAFCCLNPFAVLIIKIGAKLALLRCGGEGGIRTLETLLRPTRFPVVRARPSYATSPYLLYIQLIRQFTCSTIVGKFLPLIHYTKERTIMQELFLKIGYSVTEGSFLENATSPFHVPALSSLPPEQSKPSRH